MNETRRYGPKATYTRGLVLLFSLALAVGCAGDDLEPGESNGNDSTNQESNNHQPNNDSPNTNNDSPNTNNDSPNTNNGSNNGDDCQEGQTDGELVCVNGTWVDQSGPCETVDCGPNGSCVEVGDAAECDCDDGFEEQNQTCISTSNDPCEGVDCGDGGSCVEASGMPQCECDEGYDAEGLECVELPSCQGVTGDCTAHILHAGDNSYEVVEYAETELAAELDGPIIAAFALEDTDRGYLMTESSYFQFNTEDFTVLDSGTHAEMHPDVASGAPITTAYTVPTNITDPDTPGDGNDSVTFVRNPDPTGHGEALILSYDFASATFEDVEDPDSQGWQPIDWGQDDLEEHIPSVDSEFVASWLDAENYRNFLQGSTADACDGIGPDDSEGVIYLAFLTTESIHFSAAAGCFPFLSSEDNDTAGLFNTFPHAPNHEDVGGGFWHQRALYLFTTGYFE